jgi:hypothetical protein
VLLRRLRDPDPRHRHGGRLPPGVDLGWHDPAEGRARSRGAGLVLLPTSVALAAGRHPKRRKAGLCRWGPAWRAGLPEGRRLPRNPIRQSEGLRVPGLRRGIASVSATGCVLFSRLQIGRSWRPPVELALTDDAVAAAIRIEPCAAVAPNGVRVECLERLGSLLRFYERAACQSTESWHARGSGAPYRSSELSCRALRKRPMAVAIRL